MTLGIGVIDLGTKLVSLNAQQYDRLLTFGLIAQVIVSFGLWVWIEHDEKKHKAAIAAANTKTESLNKTIEELRASVAEIYAQVVLAMLKHKQIQFFTAEQLASDMKMDLAMVTNGISVLEQKWKIVSGNPQGYRFERAAALPLSPQFFPASLVFSMLEQARAQKQS